MKLARELASRIVALRYKDSLPAVDEPTALLEPAAHTKISSIVHA